MSLLFCLDPFFTRTYLKNKDFILWPMLKNRVLKTTKTDARVWTADGLSLPMMALKGAVAATEEKLLENGGMLVTETGDSNEIATIQDLLMANSMQLDAIAQLLIEKGIFSKEDLFNMLKRIQKEYQKTGNTE